MAITTSAAFLAILEKSELLTAEQLTAAKRDHAEIKDAQALAAALVKQGLLTPWQTRKLLAGQHALFLGKFKLLDRLPWGDSGRVYLAEHTRMRSRVALKTLDRRQTEDPQAVARFQKEGTVAASLDHPHIIHVRDFDCENNYYYLVMEHVDAEDLARKVSREGPLPALAAAGYIAQAAAGLAHAHQEGVLHRTIKPSRVLVTSEGGVKLMDLGAAQMSQADDQADPASNRYTAPEVLADREAADERSDIYALGATLFYLLAGAAPPPASELAANSKTAGDLLRRRSAIPKEMADLCGRMLALKPDDRFATAAEVAQAFNQWLAANRPATPPPVADESASSDERRVLKTREKENKSASGEFALAVEPSSPARRARTGGARPVASGAAKSGSSLKQNGPLYFAIGGGVVVLILVSLGAYMLLRDKTPIVAEVDPAAESTDGVEVKPSTVKKPASAKPEITIDFPQPGEANASDEKPAAAGADADMPTAAPPAADAPPQAEAPKAEPPKAEPPQEEAPAVAAPATGTTPVKLHPVELVSITSLQGTKFQRLEGTPPTYLASGGSPDDKYEIVVTTEAEDLTGIAVLALPHDQLPKGGPGRSAADGDFKLNRVRLSASDSNVFISSSEVKLTRAEADFSAANAPVANALDADEKKVWSIAGQAGKPHWAVFRAAEPIKIAGKTWLKVALAFNGDAAIGRLRIVALSGDFPVKPELFKDQLPTDSPPAWNPLKNFAQAVTLPVLDDTAAATTPFELGSVAPDFELNVGLLGGNAAHARQAFSIRLADPGQWNILLHEAKATDTAGQVVAQVKRDGPKLLFQWDEAAKSLRDANHLRNCLFQLDGSGQTHQMVLRQSVEASPVAVNFEKGRDAAKADLEWLPDPQFLKVEVLPGDALPPHDFATDKIMPAQKGELAMLFGAEEKLIQFNLQSDLSARGVQVQLSPYIVVDAMAKPMQFNKANFQRLESTVSNAFAQISGGQLRIEEALKSKKLNENQKLFLQEQKANLDIQLPLVQAGVEKMEKLKSLAQGLAGARVGYRVLYQIDEQQFELARATALAAPPPELPAE